MLRPIFRRILPGSMLESGSGPTGGAPTGKSGGAGTHGITLTTITARGTRARKSLDGDEGSSTHQLADDDDANGSDPNLGDYGGRSTTPLGSRNAAYPLASAQKGDDALRGGIVVKSEMKVAFEPA
jgi:hypothetical protein